MVLSNIPIVRSDVLELRTRNGRSCVVGNERREGEEREREGGGGGGGRKRRLDALRCRKTCAFSAPLCRQRAVGRRGLSRRGMQTKRSRSASSDRRLTCSTKQATAQRHGAKPRAERGSQQGSAPASLGPTGTPQTAASVGPRTEASTVAGGKGAAATRRSALQAPRGRHLSFVLAPFFSGPPQAPESQRPCQQVQRRLSHDTIERRSCSVQSTLHEMCMCNCGSNTATALLEAALAKVSASTLRRLGRISRANIALLAKPSPPKDAGASRERAVAPSGRSRCRPIADPRGNQVRAHLRPRGHRHRLSWAEW